MKAIPISSIAVASTRSPGTCRFARPPSHVGTSIKKWRRMLADELAETSSSFGWATTAGAGAAGTLGLLGAFLELADFTVAGATGLELRRMKSSVTQISSPA